MTWLEESRDPAVQAAVKEFSVKFEAYTRKQEQAIVAAVPSARVVSLRRANHLVFISHEADVLREMDAFIGNLR